MAFHCDKCGRGEHHDPGCPEMFFGGDRSKPRGTPGVMPARAEGHAVMASIVARKVRVFVPTDVAVEESPARTRAGTWAHFAAGMGTPVVESSQAVRGGHLVDLVELGDAEVSARARTDKR